MRFKKIEIDAFRAYSNKDGGTFNFELANGLSANLVSIYAPNGFGKSSFYDAVEWGLTNRISRLDANKDEGHIEKENTKDQYVLKHNEASPNTTGTVKITFDGGSSIENKTLKVNGKRKSDYYFSGNKSELRREYFRRVILSQEGISAFLRTEQPDCRYEQFSKYFGDVQLEKFFKNIVALIRENDINLRALKDDAKKLKTLKTEKKIDSQVIKEVNSLLKKLNQYKSELPDFIQEDIVKFKQDINTVDINLTHDRIKYQDLLDKTIQALNELPGFQTIKETAKSTSDSIKFNEKLVERFNELDGFNNKFSKIIAEQAKLKDRFNVVKDLLPKYFAHRDLIEKSTKTYNNLFDSYEQLENDILEKKIEISNSQSKIDQFSKLEIAKKLEIENLDKELDELSKLTKEKISKEKREQTLNSKIFELQNNINSLNSLSKELLLFHRSINKNYDKLNGFERISPLYFDLIDSLKSNSENNKSISSKLQECESQISNLNTFEKNLLELVHFGKQIIAEQISTACPLCGNNNFKNKNDLLLSIEKNSILSSDRERLGNEYTKYKNEIDRLELRATAIKSELKLKVQEQDANTQQKIIDSQLALEKLQQDLESNKLTWQPKEERYSILSSKFKKDKESFTAQLESELYELYINKEGSITALNALQTQLTQLTSSFNQEKINLGIASNQLKQKGEDSIIALYNEAIDKDKGLLEISSLNLQDKTKDLEEEIFLLEVSITKLKKQIASLNKDLSSFSFTQLKEDLSDLRLSLSELESKSQIFITSLKFLGLKGSDKALQQILESRYSSLSNDLSIIDEQLVITEKLESHFETIEKYLELHRINNKLEELKTKIDNLENIGEELDKSKRAISNKLTAHIKKFFQEKLINDIYQYIDPHPDYKEITFHADLTGNKGCLYIKVKGKDSEKEFSPVLYFSSAQINVLSLSIFLARALHAKDDDGNEINCIFMDDPVQSMDSINVLSLIDLLRSIVVNYNKQIIISTHDENFHHLLQKKMPKESFSTKFIELETFGKVGIH